MQGAFELGNKLTKGPNGQPINRTTITTQSLATLDLANPDPSDIFLVDIAHGLSQICRWAGQGCWYSVAQHSLEVCWRARRSGFDRNVQLAALFHDAHEAYTGDPAGGLKLVVGDGLKKVLVMLDEAIAARYGIDGLTDEYEGGIVREIEDSLILPEYEMLFLGRLPREFGLSEPMERGTAKVSWLAAAESLLDGRKSHV